MMKAKESYYTPGVAISGLENCRGVDGLLDFGRQKGEYEIK
jgi:hypothetical protein